MTRSSTCRSVGRSSRSAGSTRACWASPTASPSRRRPQARCRTARRQGSRPPWGPRSRTSRGARSPRTSRGNTVQICPVGALTGAAYRFRSRPFDLVSTPSVGEHDACGVRDPHRPPPRRGPAPAVGRGPARSTRSGSPTRTASRSRGSPRRTASPHPLVRDREVDAEGRVTRGELRPRAGPRPSRSRRPASRRRGPRGGVGVLPGGRLTVEDAYAYGKFARVVLGTNDVDHRARVHSTEEADFLAHAVAGTGLGVTFDDLEQRTRGAARRPRGGGGGRRHVPAAAQGRPEARPAGLLARTLREPRRAAPRRHAPAGGPGHRGRVARGARHRHPDAVRARRGRGPDAPESVEEPAELSALRDALAEPGAVVLVGERLAGVARRVLGAAAPRRGARAHGSRGSRAVRASAAAVEAGTLPALLPGRTPRAPTPQPGSTWPSPGASSTSRRRPAAAPARSSTRCRWASSAVCSWAVCDADDLPDPAHTLRALEAAGFVVSLEVRASEVTERARTWCCRSRRRSRRPARS